MQCFTQISFFISISTFPLNHTNKTCTLDKIYFHLKKQTSEQIKRTCIDTNMTVNGIENNFSCLVLKFSLFRFWFCFAECDCFLFMFVSYSMTVCVFEMCTFLHVFFWAAVQSNSSHLLNGFRYCNVFTFVFFTFHGQRWDYYYCFQARYEKRPSEREKKDGKWRKIWNEMSWSQNLYTRFILLSIYIFISNSRAKNTHTNKIK